MILVTLGTQDKQFYRLLEAVQKQIDKQNSYTNVFEGSESEEAPITVNESDLFMASLEARRGRNREDDEEKSEEDTNN